MTTKPHKALICFFCSEVNWMERIHRENREVICHTNAGGHTRRPQQYLCRSTVQVGDIKDTGLRERSYSYCYIQHILLFFLVPLFSEACLYTPSVHEEVNAHRITRMTHGPLKLSHKRSLVLMFHAQKCECNTAERCANALVDQDTLLMMRRRGAHEFFCIISRFR